MAEFNITNSKIEQVNDSGSNYKVSNNSAPVVVTGGDAVQTVGDKNRVQANAPEKPSVMKWIGDKLRSLWGLIWGTKG